MVGWPHQPRDGGALCRRRAAEGAGDDVCDPLSVRANVSFSEVDRMKNLVRGHN